MLDVRHQPCFRLVNHFTTICLSSACLSICLSPHAPSTRDGVPGAGRGTSEPQLPPFHTRSRRPGEPPPLRQYRGRRDAAAAAAAGGVAKRGNGAAAAGRKRSDPVHDAHAEGRRPEKSEGRVLLTNKRKYIDGIASAKRELNRRQEITRILGSDRF